MTRLTTAWDEGVTWFLQQSAAQAPDMDDDPLTLSMIREQHLRLGDEGDEDEFLEHLRLVSYRQAEIVTRRSLLPQTWVLVMNRFPDGPILLPKAPVIDVDSIAYVAADGTASSLDSSPAWWQLVQPTGPHAGRVAIHPAQDEFWPSTAIVPSAVSVTFEAGYAANAIPVDITHGRLLLIAELYRKRGMVDGLKAADPLWKRYTVYGS